MDTTGHLNQSSHSANHLDAQTSTVLTASVPWVWICAIPFLLIGVLAFVIAGLGMLAAFKLGGSMIILSGIQFIQAIVVLYLGINLTRFASNVSKYKHGDSSALHPAFESLGAYFRITGILILLSIALVGLMLVLGVGAGMLGR